MTTLSTDPPLSTASWLQGLWLGARAAGVGGLDFSGGGYIEFRRLLNNGCV